MLYKYSILLLVLLLLGCDSKEVTIALKYPSVKKTVVMDTIGSKVMPDPYRHLENLKDNEVISWFKKQGNLTDSVLSFLNNRDAVYKQLIGIEAEATPKEIVETYRYTEDGEYYILKKKKEDTVAKLYHRKSLRASEKLIFDPSDHGDSIAVNYFKYSPDNSKMAIAMAPKGVKSSTLVILDLRSGDIMPNKLTNVTPDLLGGINWLPDSTGFYYVRFPHLDPRNPTYLERSKTFLHYLDTTQDTDIEVFSKRKSPEINLTKADFPLVQTRKSNADLIIGRVSGNSPYKDIYYAKVSSKKSFENPDWKPLFKKGDQIDQYFIVGDTLFYRTSKNASNFKIAKAPIGSDYSKGIDLVNEIEDAVLTDFEVIGNDVYYVKVSNGVRAQLVRMSDLKTVNIPLPYQSGSCYIRNVHKNLVVTTTGWTKLSESYLFNTQTEEFIPIHLEAPKYPDAFSNFIVEEVEVTSHDGVKVPLSIIRHPDTKLDGKARTKITAYGAYGDSFSPYLMINNLNWVASGNIMAIAHVRGGGEKGDAWHKGGFKTRKANSWKDYIACTEYLIENKYTNPNRTIATGTSAGTIVIANAIVLRPDLFKVGISYVGFINATRSEFQPNGANSKKEFGALDIPEEAQGLIDMDAYLKIKEDVAYPAVYAYVGLNDGMVAAWDSGKFIARLQNDSATTNPVLLAVDRDGGHGGGGTAHKAYQIYADVDAFALWQTGHPDYQPKQD